MVVEDGDLVMINFNVMPSIYWSDVTKISYLQRMIIIWSIMYYELNESCVPDKFYDSVAYQLVELQNKVNEEALKKTEYHYVMSDFDATTGFDISSRLTESDREYLTHLAKVILFQCKTKNAKNEGRKYK